jgi:hypothetical protein
MFPVAVHVGSLTDGLGSLIDGLGGLTDGLGGLTDGLAGSLRLELAPGVGLGPATAGRPGPIR